MQARIVRAPARVATPLRPCGDPRLRGAVTSHGRGYSSACRPTSGSAKIAALSGVVASGSKWQLFKYGHRGPGKSGTAEIHPVEPFAILRDHRPPDPEATAQADPNRSFVAGADVGRPRSKTVDQGFSRDAQRFKGRTPIALVNILHRGGAKCARPTGRAQTRRDLRRRHCGPPKPHARPTARQATSPPRTSTCAPTQWSSRR